MQTLKNLRIHPAFAALAKERLATPYAVVEVQPKRFAAKLGFVLSEGESVWNCFPPYGASDCRSTRP